MTPNTRGSGYAQNVLLQRELKHSFITIATALNIVNAHSNKILNKQSRTTDEKLNHQITLADIARCNKILKDLQGTAIEN